MPDQVRLQASVSQIPHMDTTVTMHPCKGCSQAGMNEENMERGSQCFQQCTIALTSPEGCPSPHQVESAVTWTERRSEIVQDNVFPMLILIEGGDSKSIAQVLSMALGDSPLTLPRSNSN